MKTKEERKAYAAAYWIVYRETHKEEIADTPITKNPSLSHSSVQYAIQFIFF